MPDQIGLTDHQFDRLSEKLFQKIAALSDEKVVKLTEMKLAPDSRIQAELSEYAYIHNNFKLSESQLARYDKLILAMEICNLIKAVGANISRQRGILNFDKFPSLRDEN